MNNIEIKKRKSKLKSKHIKSRFRIKKSYQDHSLMIKERELDDIIIEKTLDKIDVSNVSKLRVAKNYSDIIKSYNDKIGVLKDLCVDLYFDDIKYKFVGYYEVTFSRPIYTLMSNILSDLKLEDDEVIDRVNRDDSSICLEIDSDNLNKIDIINGLSNFMMGIGLGKKMYKKLIKDLGFLSSFYGGDTNLNSSMVWKSLSSDSDLFMFCNDNNIICFWHELEYIEYTKKILFSEGKYYNR